MLRRVVLVAGVVVLAGSGLLTGRAALDASAAVPGAVACKITGTANLIPGVTTLPKATSYTFSGSLLSCKSTDKTISSGTVSASGSGNLGCAGGTSKGTATVTWNNGQTTSVSFSTDDAGSLVAVSGGATGGEFSGDKVAGALNFVTTAVTSCTKTGLTTLNFTGAIGTV